MAKSKPKDKIASGSELANVSPLDDRELRQFVTPLLSMEHQVGSHVIHALQQNQTVAVLTTVMPGPNGAQCIVSVALNAERMEQVQDLLSSPEAVEEPRVPCVGFHCFLPPRDAGAAGEGGAGPEAEGGSA